MKEEIPFNMPEPRGVPIEMTLFCDADHAGNAVTRRSHTGLLMFLNNAPVNSFSKAQATVKTFTFGSKGVVMRLKVNMIQALRHKLRMMGVEIDGSCEVHCDNKGLVNTVSAPESTSKKKHNAINWHRIREACAMNMIRVGEEDTKTDLADLLTKCLSLDARRALLHNILWW